MLKNYLYIENEASKVNRFQLKLFELLPYIGLRWYETENDESPAGWIFGGNIRITNVGTEPPLQQTIMIQTSLYPFVLEIALPSRVLHVRLACDALEVRQQWVDALLYTIGIHNYIYACVECNAAPSQALLDMFLADSQLLIVENTPLSIPTFGSLVMLSKLTHPEGSSLRILHLDNCQLSDKHIPLLTSLLTFSSSLDAITLSNNYITCAGLTELSASLAVCRFLHTIDISGNYIADKGISAFCEAFVPPNTISYLDISRNSITAAAAPSIAVAFASYGSNIKYFNVSYNPLANTAAALARLLLLLSPAVIEDIDISHCHVDDDGVVDIIEGLPKCTTVQHIQLTGNLFTQTTSAKLFDALTRHQSKYGICNPRHEKSKLYYGKSKVAVRLGGLMLDAVPVSLAQVTLRSAMAYSSIYTSFDHVCLQRRLSSMENAGDCALKYQNLCCVRIQLSSVVENAQLLMCELATLTQAHTSQFSVISQSYVDNTRSCYILFIPCDATAAVSAAHYQQYNTMCRAKTIKYLRKIGRGKAPTPIEPYKPLPSAEKIARMLQEFAKSSHSHLLQCGIRTFYIQRSEKDNKTAGLGAFHCYVRHTQREEYFPAPFPTAVETIEEGLPDTEEILSTSEVASLAESVAEVSLDSEPSEDESVDSHEDHRSVLDDIESDRSSLLMESMQSIPANQNINSKIMNVIRKLYQEQHFTLPVAQFWQHAFGEPKFESVYTDVIESAYDEDGIYFNVAIRKHLCDAMISRDVQKLQIYVELVQNDKLHGGQAFVLAEKMLSEISTLLQDASNLDSLAQGPSDINIVEQFLVSCAKLGYAGNETMRAIELREYLVRWALEEDPSYSDELKLLQKRALLTNTMISRDFVALRTALNSTENSAKVPSQLRQIGNKLLDDAALAKTQLENALKTNKLEDIEDAVAFAAYLNVYDPLLGDAVDAIIDLSSDATLLCQDIVSAIRDGDASTVEALASEARRVGWSHAAVQSRNLMMLLEERNRIMQEELLKVKLIDMANDLKQGREPSTVTAMQLLRNVKALHMEADASVAQHIGLIDRYMRKMAGVASQEEVILRLIDEKNWQKLSEILSGRGEGRLMMSATNEESMLDWIAAIERVCQQTVSSPDILKRGTLEKASRGKEGLMRNWKQRYFVLEGSNISYYTKAGGEKKGSVRVQGGAVRRLSPGEIPGRQYCFELQEGRDLSDLDPELLSEAKKQLMIMHKEMLDEQLVDAIEAHNENDCSDILDRATSLNVSLDSELLLKAKAILMKKQQRLLKLELLECCSTIPRGQLLELLKTAKRLRLDGHLVKKAQLLTETPETELTILRARGCLSSGDEAGFKRSLATIQRIDMKRLSIREKKILVAVLLEHSGAGTIRSLLEGCGAAVASRQLKQTLDACMQYFVETEPMDLARLVLSNDVSTTDDLVTSTTFTTRTQSMSAFDVMHPSVETTSRANAAHYAIEKFDQLRHTDTVKQTRTSFFGRKRADAEANAVFSFSQEAIQKSLSTIPKNMETTSIDLFTALQIIMTDRQPQAYPKNEILANGNDLASLANDVVCYGVKNAGIRDEMYLQLVKQLSRNSRIISRLRGWSLMAVYLHSFPPTTSLNPYLQNFLAQALTNVEKRPAANVTTDLKPRRRSSATRYDTVDDEWSLQLLIPRLVQYCSRLLVALEKQSPFNRRSIAMTDRALLNDAIHRNAVGLEVVSMTGIVHRLRVKFGDIDTPFSLLCAVFNQLMDVSGIESTQSATTESCSQYISTMQQLYRGFALYDAESHTANDMLSYPVQPDESYFLDWNTDLLWDLLQGSGDVRRFVIRRRFFLVSEPLLNEIALFGEELSDRDVVSSKALWYQWLSSVGDLPINSHRIDLLFAEESRYVNSMLYAANHDALAYLIALQLTISTDCQSQFDIFSNVDSSVLPCSMKKCRVTSDFKLSHAKQQQKNRTSITSLDAAETASNESDDYLEEGIMLLEDMTEEDFELMENKLRMLGISSNIELLHAVIPWMSQFQSLAAHCAISTSNERFRYMLKAAYMSYLKAWPLCGSHFWEAAFSDGAEETSVLVGVNGNGIHLLTPDEWALLFHAPIYDIQKMEIKAMNRQNVSKENRLLILTINGMKLSLLSTYATEIQRVLENYSLELLGRGCFPHGSEGGEDILEISEKFVPSNDSKTLMKQFLKSFPILPTPPPVLMLQRSEYYFEAPKSPRAILAEQRAEEERFEREQARLAQESHAMKTIANLERGKATLQEFNEEEDEVERRSSMRKKRRGLVKTSEEVIFGMINAALCGVSDRPPIVNITIPPPPVRGAGIRVDTAPGDALTPPEKFETPEIHPPHEKFDLNEIGDVHVYTREPMQWPESALTFAARSRNELYDKTVSVDELLQVLRSSSIEKKDVVAALEEELDENDVMEEKESDVSDE